MKKFFAITTALLILLALGFYWVIGNLDSLLQTQIEAQGSAALKTRVTVQTVELDLSTGFGALRNFAIANPSGFSKNNALQFETAVLNLDTSSVKARPLIVEELRLDGIQALFEVDADGDSNLDRLLAAIEPDTTAADSGKTTAPANNAGNEVRIRIQKLSLANTALGLNLSALGGDQITQTLPTFEAVNIGGDAGLPPDALGRELGRILLTQITRGATRSAMEFVDPTLLKNIDDYTTTLEKLNRNLKDTGQNLKEGAEALGQKLKGQLKEWGLPGE